MSRVLDDFVKETSTTTGTGTYTLAGAVAGFQSFAAVGDGNTCLYSAEDGTDWETGIGTYTAAGTLLARTTVLASSNSDAAVNWGAGTKNLRVCYPASKAVTIDGTETLTNKTLTAPVITDLGLLDLSAATELTISTGAITVTQSHHTVDTESDAASDDLATITAAGDAGNVLILKAAHDARSVVLKHGTGNLNCIGNADITLDDIHDLVLAIYDGTNWTVAPLTAASGGGISNVVEDTTPQLGGDLDAQGNDIDDVGQLSFGAPVELTIASATVTATQVFHTIDTESDAVSDDLTTINGGAAGDLLVIKAENDARSVVLKHATGNILTSTNADITINTDDIFVLLMYDGTNWREIAETGVGLQNVVEDTTPELGGDLDWNGHEGDAIGRLNITGAKQFNIAAAASAPGSPSNNDIYLDDGTNTTSGYPNWRQYNTTDASWYEFGWEGPTP